MKSFGVGCFHFSINDTKSGKITVQEYINEVQSTLEQINSITDIKISFDEDLKDELFSTEPPNPQLQNGEKCHPHIPFYSLEYKVYIPYRIQASLIGTDEDLLFTNTENFNVFLKHEWHGPLSYIECVDSKPDALPSRAVQIVREYIAKEIKTLDTFLMADFLGPSPFHADFYLLFSDSEKTNENNPFTLEHKKMVGYDKLTFTCNSGNYKSTDTALYHLMDELSDEISFFYELVLGEVSRTQEWSEISESMHSILEFEDDNTKKTLLDKLFKRPKLFRKIFKDIGLFKGQEIFNININKQHYDSVYETDKQRTYLKVFNDRQISESAIYPIQEVSDLISYFDQKSSKTFELTVVFIAAIIGGVFGSLITVLYS